MNSEPHQSPLSVRTLPIAAGANQSAAIDLYYHSLLAVVMPAAWTAADLTFQASADGATFFNLYTSGGAEYTMKVDASRYVALDPTDFVGVRFLKVRSGSASAPINQAAERTLTLVGRPL